MSRNRKSKKSKVKKDETRTEEEYEEYLTGLYGMDFIAGYTAGGIPYGSFMDEVDEKEGLTVPGIPCNENEDLPF